MWRPSGEELLLDLASLPDDGVSRFRDKWSRWYPKKYNAEEILTRRDELRLLWTHRFWDDTEEAFDLPEEPSRREVARWKKEWYDQHPDAFRPIIPKRAKTLLDAWEDQFEAAFHPEDVGPLEAEICEHWLKIEKVWWRVGWGPRGGIGIQSRCLPAVLASACLRMADRLGFCRNPKCRAPYFFLPRRDQLYCSSDCARPAKRASKLRWWRERWGKSAQRRGPEPVFLESAGEQREQQQARPLKEAPLPGRRVLRPPLKRR